MLHVEVSQNVKRQDGKQSKVETLMQDLLSHRWIKTFESSVIN